MYGCMFVSQISRHVFINNQKIIERGVKILEDGTVEARLTIKR